jgi:hypothetical protein
VVPLVVEPEVLPIVVEPEVVPLVVEPEVLPIVVEPEVVPLVDWAKAGAEASKAKAPRRNAVFFIGGNVEMWNVEKSWLIR